MEQFPCFLDFTTAFQDSWSKIDEFGRRQIASPCLKQVFLVKDRVGNDTSGLISLKHSTGYNKFLTGESAHADVGIFIHFGFCTVPIEHAKCEALVPRYELISSCGVACKM